MFQTAARREEEETRMEKVLVINHNNQSLARTHPARARKLLSTGRAAIVSHAPFTIKLSRKFDAPPAHIQDLVERGAFFVVNHSGGKDSQAMAAYVRSFVPDDQILILHAPLGIPQGNVSVVVFLLHHGESGRS